MSRTITALIASAAALAGLAAGAALPAGAAYRAPAVRTHTVRTHTVQQAAARSPICRPPLPVLRASGRISAYYFAKHWDSNTAVLLGYTVEYCGGLSIPLIRYLNRLGWLGRHVPMPKGMYFTDERWAKY